MEIYLSNLVTDINALNIYATRVVVLKDEQALVSLLGLESTFLNDMNNVVLLIQEEYTQKIMRFTFLIFFDGISLILILTLVRFVIVTPLIKRTTKNQQIITKKNKQLNEMNRSLTDSNKTITLLNSELNTANLTKENFIMILAHDLRNPLNNLSSLSDILRSSIGSMNNEELVELSKMIERSAKTTLNLLVNILEWMKIQQDKITLNRELCNLLGLVVETKELFYDLAQNKKVHIRIDVPDELSLNVDREMIKTVLRNLISNALKYTPEQGEVAVKAEKDKNYVYLSVSDTGIGMNQKTLDKLFHLGEVISKSGTQGEKV